MRAAVLSFLITIGLVSAALGQGTQPPTQTAPVTVQSLPAAVLPLGLSDLLILTHQKSLTPALYQTQKLTVAQLAASILGTGTAGQVGVYINPGSILGGQGPFTAGSPVLGNGVLGLQSGGKIGSSNTFAAATGAFVNGHCRSTDSNLNEIDSGGACGGGGGSGTVNAALANQYAYYPSDGTAVAGLQAPFLHSKVFGATGNGSTDDVTALQAWVTACQASNQACWLDPGTYKISTALSVTAPLSISGPGWIAAVLAPVVGVDGIDVNTQSPVTFQGFSVNYPSSANSGTSAIKVTAPSLQNNESVFRDLGMMNAYNGLNLLNAAYFVVDNIRVNQFGSVGIGVQDQNQPDAGDGTIVNSLFLGAAASAGSSVCVQWQSGGGLRVQNNKCLTTNAGVQVELQSGATTSQLLINNNSFDGVTSALILQRQGATGSLQEVVFNNNTCSTVVQCVVMPVDPNGAWMTGLQISGNTWVSNVAGSPVFANINSMHAATVVNNTMQSGNPSSIAFICGSSAVSVAYGIFVKTGTFAANSNGCSATPISPN